MVDRRDLGSWLDGPGPSSGRTSDYPGERLGRPETGSGALARPGRRLLSLVIDWVLCLVIARGIFGPSAWEANGSLAVVAVLVIENIVLVGTGGMTFGQRLVGVQIERLDRGRVGFGRVVVRAILLGLAIPPLTLIWEQDGRGLHDLASGSVVAIR